MDCMCHTVISTPVKQINHHTLEPHPSAQTRFYFIHHSRLARDTQEGHAIKLERDRKRNCLPVVS